MLEIMDTIPTILELPDQLERVVWISALLFILVAEIIAIRIRTNTGINGIKYKELEIKISPMADDTTLFVTDLQSVEKAIEEFNK